MKKLALGVTALACLAASMSANAALIDTDTIGLKMGGGGEPETVAFSLDYDSTGWASITSAILTVFIEDHDTNFEYVQLNAVSSDVNSPPVINPGTVIGPLTDGTHGYFDLDVSSIMSVGIVDKLNGSISQVIQGDFFFDRAELNVDYSPVPVPAAVWLFASALAGLGFARRRNSLS